MSHTTPLHPSTETSEAGTSESVSEDQQLYSAGLPNVSERHLPDEWTIRRLKPILQKLQTGRRESGSKELEEGALSIGGEHIGWDGNLKLENPRYISREEYEGLSSGRVLDNDVLLVKDGATIGKTAIIEQKPAPLCAANEHVFVLKAFPDVLSQKFLYYFIRSEVGQAQIGQEITGAAQEGLNSQFASRVSVPVPPEPVQEELVLFLDQNVAHIDRLIEKKERLIELLEERRTALITKAVTKGLDPDAPMKDSGVEWLGEIPEHWDVAPLTAAIDGCYNGVWGDDPDGEHDVACLRVEDFDRFRATVATDDPTIRSVKPRYRTHRQLQVGDVLLEKSGGGEKQPVGFAVLVDSLDHPSVCSNFAARMPVREGISANFLRFVFYHLYHRGVNTRSIKQTTGIQNLDADHYLSMPFALPPESTQREIAEYLEDQTAETERLISHVHKAIERLQEYRSALITAAVTGKIDVRDHAA